MTDRILPLHWHTRPPWSYVAAVLAAALLIAVVSSIMREREQVFRQQQRSAVERDVAAHAALLQRRLDRSIAVTMLLATLVRQNADVRNLTGVATEIAASFQGVETIEFAPGGIVAAIYPAASDRTTVSTHLLEDAARSQDAQRAKDTGRLVVSSAMPPNETRRALIATLPVFMTGGNAGPESFWGFISAFIRIDHVVERNGFDDAFLRQYRFAISTNATADGPGTVYGNAVQPLSQPVSWPVRLASGNELFMHAEPAAGWPSRSGLSLDVSLLGLAALLLAILTHQLLERPARLKRQVEERTHELTEATTRLEREIDRGQLAQRHIAWLSRIHSLLSSTNEVIVRTRDREALLQKVCEIMIEAGTFGYACIYLLRPGHGMQQAAEAGDDRDCVAHLKEMYALRHSASQPAAFPVGEGDTSSIYTCNAGYASCAVFPVRTGGQTSGALVLFSDDAALFGEEQKVILDRLAEDLSYALETIDLDQRTTAAEENVRLAARVFEHSAEGILITDANNNILLVNKAFVTTTGYSAQEVIGKNPRLLHSGTHDAAFYHAMWRSIRENGEWHGEIVNRRKNGEHYPEWLSVSAVKNEAGVITNYVAVFTDLTTRKQVEDRLNFLAYYDVLTGLPNRVLFTDRLQQAIAHASRNETRIAVLFLDLDRFNLVNDTFGNAGGDVVLREVGQRLVRCVRHTDSVSRLGGDEFSIVLTSISVIHDASVVARKILSELGRAVQLHERELFISASIGISVFPEDGKDAESLVKNADSAMYRAMSGGGGAYCFYTHDMNAKSSERVLLEAQMRHALERGELELYYQPIVEAASGHILGTEALLRWQRPNHGTVPPSDFVPLLEETGLIVPIGAWVLRTACQHTKAFRQAGHDGFFCSVNLSAAQLEDPKVIETIAHALTDIPGAAVHLDIEVTESMLMRDADQAAKRLHAIKAMGVKISIDDFGTGYSSLNYLKRFPLDTLKIDQSFVRDAPHDENACAIISAVTALARSLHLSVIAEGVETLEQAEFLQRAGADMLQGFLFSRPVSYDEFMHLLRSGGIALPRLGTRKQEGTHAA